MRRLSLFVLPLLTGLLLVPAPSSAQGGGIGPDGLTRTEDDLGTWDAVLVGRTPFGRVVSERGVEINTRGCDGTCIVTKVTGALAPRNGGGRAWWRDYDAPAGALDVRTGLPVAAFVGNETPPAEALTSTTRRALPKDSRPAMSLAASRTSVEYPSDGRRIVTVYRQQPDGTEAMMLRITYTRRK